jgi:prefoldin subunit 5
VELKRGGKNILEKLKFDLENFLFFYVCLVNEPNMVVMTGSDLVIVTGPELVISLLWSGCEALGDFRKKFMQEIQELQFFKE